MKTTTIHLITRCALGAALFVAAAGATAQQDTTRPVIHEGEQLTFSVRSSRFGDMGHATMRVDADTAGGRAAYRLSFDFTAKVMLFKVSDRTRSWLDAGTLTTLRYCKTERSPVARFDEGVRVMPTLGQWSDGRRTHLLGSRMPLDELAFIYFVRGAAHVMDAEALTVARHFDEDRNPIRLTARGEVKVSAFGDSVAARVIEMEARDARQKNGKTKMTFYIGTDEASLPLRIDTSMPVAGNLTMTLTSVVPGTRVRERITAMSPGDAEESARSGQD